MIFKFDINLKVYSSNVLPVPSADDTKYSVDVVIVDEDNMSGLAFYSFSKGEWKFHTDTMCDDHENGKPKQFWWYYPPILKTTGKAQLIVNPKHV